MSAIDQLVEIVNANTGRIDDLEARLDVLDPDLGEDAVAGVAPVVQPDKAVAPVVQPDKEADSSSEDVADGNDGS